jgi:putative heme degradation protein
VRGDPARGTREARIKEIRLRLRDIADELRGMGAEWAKAHERHDILRETVLVSRETELFRETEELVGEFSELVRVFQAPDKRLT